MYIKFWETVINVKTNDKVCLEEDFVIGDWHNEINTFEFFTTLLQL